MYTQNEYVAMRIHRDAYDRAYQEAEKLRQLRQAGLLKPGLLSMISSRGASAVGRVLVAIGRRLVKEEAVTNAAFHSPSRSAAD